jgi:hypothetical protein
MVSGGDKCFGGRGNEGEEKEFHRWEDVPLIANVMWVVVGLCAERLVASGDWVGRRRRSRTEWCEDPVLAG